MWCTAGRTDSWSGSWRNCYRKCPVLSHFQLPGHFRCPCDRAHWSSALGFFLAWLRRLLLLLFLPPTAASMECQKRFPWRIWGDLSTTTKRTQVTLHRFPPIARDFLFTSAATSFSDAAARRQHFHSFSASSPHTCYTDTHILWITFFSRFILSLPLLNFYFTPLYSKLEPANPCECRNKTKNFISFSPSRQNFLPLMNKKKETINFFDTCSRATSTKINQRGATLTFERFHTERTQTRVHENNSRRYCPFRSLTPTEPVSFDST